MYLLKCLVCYAFYSLRATEPVCCVYFRTTCCWSRQASTTPTTLCCSPWI